MILTPPDRLVWVLTMLTLSAAACATRGADADVATGRQLAHDWRKGNCLACHKIPGDAQALTSADIGPPLVDMKKRFAERGRLRAQIWDARGVNPDTVMPPFGANHILTEGEIDKIVDYLYAFDSDSPR